VNESRSIRFSRFTFILIGAMLLVAVLSGCGGSSANGHAISMRAQSSFCYFFALVSILTVVCLETAICAEPDREDRTVVELSSSPFP
jgi:hypothetical protein